MAIYKKKYNVENPALNPFISYYWEIGNRSFPARNTFALIPPTASPMLHFHVGSNSYSYNNAKEKFRFSLMGQMEKHYSIIQQADVRVIGVNFKPYGLFNLLGISPARIFNQAVSLDRFYSSELLAPLCQNLNMAKDSLEGIKIIEDFFIQNKTETVFNKPYFDRMVDKMVESNGMIDFKELLHESVSPRTFQRYFNKSIGCSPQLFKLLLRHKFILKALLENNYTNLKSASNAAGYYDMSHFRKDFKRISGHNITDYQSLNPEFTKVILDA